MQEVPLEEILQAAKIVTQERKNGDSVAAIVQLLLKSGYDSSTIEKILAESDKLMWEEDKVFKLFQGKLVLLSVYLVLTDDERR